MDRPGLLAHARDALQKLYQPALLQIHPLAEPLVPARPVGERGPALKDVLLEAMRQLRPPHTTAHDAPVWRRYRSLFAFYLEGKGFGEIARHQGVSERQTRRDLHQAIEEIGDLLWARYCQLHEPPDPSTGEDVGTEGKPGQDAAAWEAEIARIGSLPPGEPVRADASLRDAVALAAKLADRLGTRLTVEVPGSLATVAVNRTALRQALLSVLGWVLDACPGGRVAVSAEEAAHRVEVVLAASGWRPDLAAAADGESGLRLGQRLLELQGGRVDVTASPGHCLVRLALPATGVPVVLVVDDNPDVSLLFRRYVQSPGIQIVQATTVEQALALVREVRPRLITLDLMMPQRDGWELLPLLTQDPATRDIPIAVCSVVHERAFALAVGASYFLPKPVGRAALLEVLERCGLWPVDRVEDDP
jgi:CheY-like chemotaxis protein